METKKNETTMKYDIHFLVKKLPAASKGKRGFLLWLIAAFALGMCLAAPQRLSWAADVDVQLSDAAGVDKFRILDSDAVAVATINSDGGLVATIVSAAVSVQSWGNAPMFRLYEADGPVNEKYTEWWAMGGQFIGRVVNDAYQTPANFMEVNHTGITIDSVIFPGAAVGVGSTATPTDTLHVNGDILATAGVHIGIDGTNTLIDDASNGTGSATLYIGNAAINVGASDRRLKENVAPSSVNALELIKKMEVMDFDWKEGTKWAGRGRATGLIAQDVYSYLPQVVDKPENPENMWAVEYQHLVPYLIKAIQEQEARIKKLEERLLEKDSAHRMGD